jgi:hypothetical protein
MALPAPPPAMQHQSRRMAAVDEEKEARDDRARLTRGEGKADKAAKMKKKDDAPRAPVATSWTVTASPSSTVGPATSLIAAIRAALASERSACLAAPDVGKPIRVRLTVDAKGRIVRVELLAGDRAVESCLRKAFMGVVSATAAQGGPAGTVEITLQAKR